MAKAIDYTDNLNIDLNVRYRTGYQAGQVQSMSNIQFQTLQGELDNNSTEDFFVNGEFIYIKSNVNGRIKFDIAKADLTDPLNPIYPEVISFIELPAGDMINQIKNITTNLVHKKYYKGQLITLPILTGSQAEIWFVASENIVAGDKVAVNDLGNGIKKYVEGEGKLLGLAKSNASSNQAIKVLVY